MDRQSIGKYLLRYGPVQPKQVEEAMIRVMETERLSGKSIVQCEHEIHYAIRFSTEELKKNGRLTEEESVYLNLPYENGDPGNGLKDRIAKEVYRAIGKAGLAKDVSTWSRMFDGFDGTSATLADLERGIRVIRTLEGVANGGTGFGKLLDRIRGRDEGERIVLDLTDKMKKTPLVSAKTVDRLLQSKDLKDRRNILLSEGKQVGDPSVFESGKEFSVFGLSILSERDYLAPEDSDALNAEGKKAMENPGYMPRRPLFQTMEESGAKTADGPNGIEKREEAELFAADWIDHYFTNGVNLTTYQRLRSLNEYRRDNPLFGEALERKLREMPQTEETKLLLESGKHGLPSEAESIFEGEAYHLFDKRYDELTSSDPQIASSSLERIKRQEAPEVASKIGQLVQKDFEDKLDEAYRDFKKECPDGINPEKALQEYDNGERNPKILEALSRKVTEEWVKNEREIAEREQAELESMLLASEMESDEESPELAEEQLQQLGLSETER